MSTRRLYWEDAYLREFDATVVAVSSWDGRPAAELDRTAFYPTSGGQPHDLGTLGAAAVHDVIEDGDRILHVLAKPLALGPVRGRIAWPRRFDHMQQHTGQHILSQAFEQLLGAQTVSFHLGDESCTIDITLSECDPQQLAQVEDLANRIVMENRAVAICEEDGDEGVGLRKQPDLAPGERLRVVSVGDFDRCACCGTHVHSTGEIGLIHLRRCERQKGNSRIEFLCGHRAVRDFRLRDEALQSIARRLSVGLGEVDGALARLEEAEAAARHEAEHLRKRLLESAWPQLLAQAEDLNGARVVCQLLQDVDSPGMRYIAQRLVERPGVVALLGVAHPAPQLCFARSEELVFDMGVLLRESIEPYGGRGGGRPHVAQGGGVREEDLEQVLARAIALVGRAGN
ncbi:MAG: hypothetical protein JXA74_12425 [Anaerolineae bacterium]|nr:hypothetical protein [Anaerolineae bacterium]